MPKISRVTVTLHRADARCMHLGVHKLLRNSLEQFTLLLVAKFHQVVKMRCNSVGSDRFLLAALLTLE